MAERKKNWGRRGHKRLPGGYLLPARLKSLVPGNDVDILRNGDQFFPALLESIGSARESVYLDFYRINDDGAGKAVGELLRKKTREGVEVGIIYDDIGSFASGEYFKWLDSSGVRTAAFNPVSLFRSRLGINRRDHRKMVIVDGRVGLLGGLNIADEYGDPTAGWKGWRDTAVRVEGPVVRQMVSIFLESWHRLGGFPIEHAGKYLSEHANRKEHPDSGMSAFIVGTERIWRRRDAIKAYRKAVWRAKRSIRIQSAYFIPPYTMRLAMRRAAQRGVSVKIIVPLQGDLLLNHFASRRTFGPLMKAGVEIFQLPGPVMHAKTAVIDGVWSTVGSFNQNHRSFFHDIEVNLLVVDESFGAKMEKSFTEDLARSIPVDPRKWRERPLGEKFLERVCYALRHWL
jgi:cardiolipin synthase